MMRFCFLFLVAVLTAFLFCGAAAASEIMVELPDTPIPVGETITVPVVMTDADKLETFTITIPNTIPGVNVSINESATNALRSGSYINNAYSATEGRILWFSTSAITGDKVTLFYLDITPSVELSSRIPLTLNLDDIGVNGEVSPVTSYIVPQNGVQMTAAPTPVPEKTSGLSPTVATPAVQRTSAAPVPSAAAQTSVPTVEETVPLSSGDSAAPAPTATPLGCLAVLAGAAAAVFAGRKQN